MSANSMCRVCLVDNVNLYSVQNDLQNVYERIAKEKYNKVGYPVHMCYICLAVLRKCHRLMETARDTNNVLKQWYKQQNEERVARPLFTYSISKVDVVSTYNGNISLQHVIKMEEVDLGVDEVQLDDLECSAGVDIENTDLHEQTDHCELLVDNDNTYTIEYNYDNQTDRYFKKIDFEETSSIVSNLDVHTIETISLHDNDTRPIKRRKTNKIKPQHQVSETSGETGANNETSNITPLSSTPSPPDNIRHRNLIFDSNQSKKETTNLNKIVKTNVIQNKKKRLARNTIKKRNNFNKLALNTSVMKKHEINSNKVEQHFTRQKTSHITDKPFSCDICNYKCNRKYVLTQHMKTHTGEKPFLCDICDFKCTQKSNLKTHTRIHTKEKPFLCDICNYKCNRKNILTRHMKTHTREKPFLCDICDFKFTHKSHLKKHTRIHTKEKPFLCDICNYKCNCKYVLTQHMKTHTGKKPYLCDICDYKFTEKYDLVRHIRTHTGDKPFSCNVCDFKCTQKNNLKMHTRRIHTKEKPFSCDICNYKFTGKSSLVRHVRTHTGDKPFSCNVCDFKCTQKSNLKIHTRIHTKEKPLACDICNYKCIQKGDLIKHK